LLQDIAMALWQALPRFRGDCSERTFLFRIAHNRGIAHSVTRRRKGALATEIDPADPAPGPEAVMVQQTAGRRLRSAIRDLPVVHRQVIVLALEDLSYAEIAQVLGITESNVGVRLNRARQLLRSRLEDRR
jgi:RNA polymerase sigma factor (sigma-70 family)